MSLADHSATAPLVRQGAAAAISTFLVQGTVTAMWANSVFVRMMLT
jgi:hypothetical protein